MRVVKFRGKWAAYVPGKNGRKGKRYSLRTADYEEALSKFEEFKRQYEQKNETVGEIVEAYLEAKKDKPSIGGMGDGWRSARSFFKDLLPWQISKRLCHDYCQSRLGVSNGTLRKELGVIRQALRWKDPTCTPDIDIPPEAPPLNAENTPFIPRAGCGAILTQ